MSNYSNIIIIVVVVVNIIFEFSFYPFDHKVFYGLYVLVSGGVPDHC